MSPDIFNPTNPAIDDLIREGRSEGLYEKYVVFHRDDLGDDDQPLLTTDLGIFPIDNFTFVLRPDRDYHARVALAAYMASVEADSPLLAEDLRGVLDLLETPERGAPD